jgi:protein-tyrosine phosphatase
MTAPRIRLCFVCLGNICRSPTAEGVMKKLVLEAGLQDRVFIDSAGTGAYHLGELADPRSRAEALRRGVVLESRARQFVGSDYDSFDYLLAADRRNRDDLARLARDPSELRKLHLLRNFDPQAAKDSDIPDPYQGGPQGFMRVFDICEAACNGLLDHLRRAHPL